MPWILRLLIYVTCFFILEFYFFKKLFNSVRILYPDALKPKHKRVLITVILLLNLFPITQFVNWTFELLFDFELFDFGHSFIESYLIHYPFWINILIVLQSSILLLPVDLIRAILNPFLKKYRDILKVWNARLILLVYIFFAVYVPLRIYYDINFVEVRFTEYKTDMLPPSLQGFKIGLIADIQADYYTDEHRMSNYIDKLNAAEPDLVLIAGDVITNSADYIPAAAEALGQIKSKYGIYASVGDHDNWAYGRNIMKSRREVVETLDKKGIYMLDDVNYKLNIDSAVIGITFITDTYSDRISRSLLDSLTTNLHGSDLRILLSHQPNYKIVQRAIDNKYNLMLAGHTHGGQITILFPFLNLSPTMFETKYVRGDFWFDNTMLVVCRGLGFSIAPVRFNSTPEVVVIELSKL